MLEINHVKGNGSGLVGEMVRAVLRTVVMGKRGSQKELEMILGSPLSLQPSTLEEWGEYF